MAMWLVATMLHPVGAISKSSSVRLQNDPAPIVGVGLPALTAGGGPVRAAIFNGNGVKNRIAGIPIKLTLIDADGCMDPIVAFTEEDGVASFRPVVSCLGFGFELRASAADGASVNSSHIARSEPSAPFDVVAKTACKEAERASATTTRARPQPA